MIVSAAHVRLVLTTAGSHEEAERIAGALVDERLAACVNLIPGLTSVYRWQGAVETANEVLLIIKTTSENLDRVEAELRRMHSYEMPEFLVLHPGTGRQEYLDWLLQSAKSNS